jgi:hypothetical protein
VVSLIQRRAPGQRRTERVEHDKQVDGNNGEDGIAVELAGRRVHCAVYADVEKRKRLTSGSYQQGPFSANLLSESHEANGSDHDLHDSVL